MKLFLSLSFWLFFFVSEATEYELFEVQGKVGLKDESGKILLPPSFESLGWSDGSFSVIGQVTGYRLNNQWGLVNLKKDFITKPIFETVTNSGGYVVVAKKRINPIEYKAGCIDLKGEVVIPFVYDGITLVGLEAIVFKKERSVFKYGLISLKNEVVIPLKYRNIQALGFSKFAVENDEGQVSIYSNNGNALTLFSFDSISAHQGQYAIVHQGWRQGLIDREGNIVVEPRYRQIKINRDGSFIGQLPSQCQLLRGDNTELNNVEADGLFNSYDRNYKIKRGNFFGLVDDQLKTIVSPQYKVFTEMGSNRYLAKTKKYGIVDINNSVVLPFEFDSILTNGNSIRVSQNKSNPASWFLYDTLGKRKTSSGYQWIGEERDGYLSVKKRGYWGVINISGEELIHCVYDSIVNHVEDKFVVKLKNAFGVINTHEDWLVAPQPYPILVLRNNRMLISIGKIFYLKDFSGNIVYFSENTLTCTSEWILEKLANGNERKLDYDGRLITNSAPLKVEKVETVFEESEGFRGIKKDGKFGFIDKRGNLRIANRYEAIQPFKEGLAAVKLNGKWGFINIDERIVIQPMFEFVSSFAQGKALVRRNKKYGMINQENKFILTSTYDSIQALPSKNYLLVIGHLRGLANKEGQIILEPKFDQLTDLENGYLIAERDGKFGLLTREGLSTIPLLYDQLIYNPRFNNYLVMKNSDWQMITPKKSSE